MTTYAPCDSAGPKCTGSGASEGGTTVHPLIVSIAGEPKGHGGPTPVAALAALLHRGACDSRAGRRMRKSHEGAGGVVSRQLPNCLPGAPAGAATLAPRERGHHVRT